jgi:ankyrin repeat protein
VEQLLAREDVDINSKDRFGITPLSLVTGARGGKSDIGVVKALLLRKDVDINAKSNSKQTPLMEAVWQGNLEVMKLLLEYKNVDINCVEFRGWTALVAASIVDTPKVEAVQLLLQHGAIRIVNGLNAYEMALSNYARFVDDKKEGKKILDAYSEVPEVLESVELSDLSYWIDSDDRDLGYYNQVLWTTLGDHPATEKDIEMTSIFRFASLPKDKLRQTEQDLIRRVLDRSKSKCKETKVEAPIASPLKQRSVHSSEMEGEPDVSGLGFQGSISQNAEWTWIHVPANNVCSSLKGFTDKYLTNTRYRFCGSK